MKSYNTWRSTPLFMGLVMGVQLVMALWVGYPIPLWGAIFLFCSSCFFIVIWLLFGKKASIFLEYRKQWMEQLVEDAHFRYEVDNMILETGCLPPSQKEEDDAS